MTTQELAAVAASTDMFSAPSSSAEALSERLLAATLGTMELTAVYLGERLGWYRALADSGPLRSADLAAMTGTAERYAREWLEHQAASGYLEVLDVRAHHTTRRFDLPAVPELDARLRAGARVADVGCGEGSSAIGLALATPTSRSTGSTSTPRRSRPHAATRWPRGSPTV